jgi:hypothetical protein
VCVIAQSQVRKLASLPEIPSRQGEAEEVLRRPRTKNLVAAAERLDESEGAVDGLGRILGFMPMSA